jgi:hypothetical protein
MKPEIEGPSSGTWIIVLFGIALLLIALFFHIVVTPDGPTRMTLITKSHATLRLSFISLPGYIEANTETLRRTYYLEFQLITDPLVRHLVIELWRRGALQRALSL